MVEESLVVVTVCCDPIAVRSESGFDFAQFGASKMRAARKFSTQLLDRLRLPSDDSNEMTRCVVPVQQRRLKDGRLTMWDVGARRPDGLNRVFYLTADCDPSVVQFLNATAESVFKELVREYEVNEGF